MNKPDLKDLTRPELAEFIQELGLPAYRARQIFTWLYRPGTRCFEQMTDIKKELRENLSNIADFSFLEPEVIEKSDDGTIKFGFRLCDGNLIETVMIPEQDRRTLCISSQVGCAMGCTFCLTGTMGFIRNLKPSEMVNQICAVKEYLLKSGYKTSNTHKETINSLVFMGMGEPLANFDNLITALDIISDQRGLDFSDRRITVSTCGIVPRIKELGDKVKVNLAISLHAIDDNTRTNLMPVNKKYNIDELLSVCREFPLPKRKRIMFEYMLIKDVNDSLEDARILADKLKNIPCKINLLPYNESEKLPFKCPSDEDIEKFQKVLWRAGYTALVRNSRGSDISAACGQLAGK